MNMDWFYRLFNSPPVVILRSVVARVRRRIDPIYIYRLKRRQERELEQNAPYEREDKGLYYPLILSLEETMRKIIDERLSVCRYGDGEFEIVVEQKGLATFQAYDDRLRDRMREILGNPIPQCLCCIPPVYASLARFREADKWAWRRVARFSREKVFRFFSPKYLNNEIAFGDALISRAYLGVADASLAPRIYKLWKELFSDKDILLVEGRYSRLGVGNDLLSGARTTRRIWCPATNAFDRYDEILCAVRRHAKKDNLIVLALGMTATVLAYDLAKEGFWAVDAGHVDVEYMWMKMGVDHKVPIPGRYVNECADGHEQVVEPDEVDKYNVVETIGF